LELLSLAVLLFHRYYYLVFFVLCSLFFVLCSLFFVLCSLFKGFKPLELENKKNKKDQS
jgi:hypothetical protein